MKKPLVADEDILQRDQKGRGETPKPEPYRELVAETF